MLGGPGAADADAGQDERHPEQQDHRAGDGEQQVGDQEGRDPDRGYQQQAPSVELVRQATVLVTDCAQSSVRVVAMVANHGQRLMSAVTSEVT